MISTSQLKYITIEGIVGARKSTVLRALQEDPEIGSHIFVLPEDVDTWVQEGYMALYSSKPERYGLMWQTYIFCDFRRKLKEAFAQNKLIVGERSLLSCVHVFATQLKQRGYLHEKELAILQKMLEEEPKPDLCIYLDLPLDKAMEGVHKRNREGEELYVTNTYQTELTDLHTRMFQNDGISSLIVSSDGTQEEVATRVKDVFRSLLSLLPQEDAISSVPPICATQAVDA